MPVLPHHPPVCALEGASPAGGSTADERCSSLRGTFPSRGRQTGRRGLRPLRRGRGRTPPSPTRASVTPPLAGEVNGGRFVNRPYEGRGGPLPARSLRDTLCATSLRERGYDTSSVIRLAGDGGCHLLLKEKALGGGGGPYGKVRFRCRQKCQRTVNI